MAATTKKAAAKKPEPKKAKVSAEVPDDPFYVEPDGPTGSEITELPDDPFYVDGLGIVQGESPDTNDRNLYTLQSPQSKNPDDRPYMQ